MRALLFIDWRLRRCWVLGRRLHHGKLGVLLAVCGVCLCAHDRSDWRDWFRREPL